MEVQRGQLRELIDLAGGDLVLVVAALENRTTFEAAVDYILLHRRGLISPPK